jgi:flavin-dependent dehydrogenase
MQIRVPEKWDMEYDVIVVGWGAAGSAAAVTAHDQGAQVLILEKMPEGGGNTRVCGGNIIIPKGKEFLNYLETLSKGPLRRANRLSVSGNFFPDWSPSEKSKSSPAPRQRN